jgi:hypothetical protein
MSTQRIIVETMCVNHTCNRSWRVLTLSPPLFPSFTHLLIHSFTLMTTMLELL